MADDRIKYDLNAYKAMTSNNEVPKPAQANPQKMDAFGNIQTPEIKRVADSPYKISPLRTFESDAAEIIEKQKHTVYTIQQAEQVRKEQVTPEQKKKKEVFDNTGRRNATMLVLSAFFFLIGLGSVLYFMLLDQAVPTPTQQAQIQSIIPANFESTIRDNEGPKGSLANDIKQVLTANPRTAESIENLNIARGNNRILPERLLTELSEGVPSALIRAFDTKNYMIGAIQKEQKVPFIILKTKEFDSVFSGMLDWEKTLGTIFDPIYKPESPAIANNIGTTDATSTSASIPVSEETILAEEFVDALVKNRPVRLIRDMTGSARVVYAFYDNETIIIAPNEIILGDVFNGLRNIQIKR